MISHRGIVRHEGINMQKTTHYVRPDGSPAHRKMLQACGESTTDDPIAIVTDLVNCKACRNTNVFKMAMLEDD